jgi:hypothetical protein
MQQQETSRERGRRLEIQPELSIPSSNLSQTAMREILGKYVKAPEKLVQAQDRK